MAGISKPFAVKGYNVTSPKGEAVWCKVTEPDTKYNTKGVYSVNLVCEPNDPTVKAFINKLEALRDQALAETKETLGAKGNQYKARPVYSDDMDANYQPTGKIVFKFVMKDVSDRTERGQQDKIIVVDAKKQQIKNIPLVGNGSEIRCVAFANPYSNPKDKEIGISLIWTKMQLISLVEFGSDGDDFDEEDGFSSEDAPFDTEEEKDELDF